MTIQFPSSLITLSPRALLQGAGDPDALENVIPSQLPDGAACWVIGEQQMYFLNKTSVAAVSPPTVIATAFGAGVPGRWLQQPGTGAASIPALSNVLFVDGGSVQATEDGSIAAPYKTITAAIAAAAAFDTILITEGDYSAEGTFAGLDKSLTLQSIRQLSYPSSVATLARPPVTIAGISINANDCDILELNGIKVTGTMAETVGGSFVLLADGCVFDGALTLPSVECFASSTEFNAAATFGGNLNTHFGQIIANVTALALLAIGTSIPAAITVTGDAQVDAYTNYWVIAAGVTITGTKTVLADLTP